MRTAVDNPFTPGSDTVPAVWAGRIEQLEDWSSVVRPRLIAGIDERGRTILGEPGLGKSTLVRRIGLQAAQSGDWVTPQVRIPAGADPLKAVATALLKLADVAGLPALREKRIGGILDRVREVSVSGISLTMDHAQGTEPYVALTDLLIDIGWAAIRAQVAVIVHIDEMQNVTNAGALSQLLIALGDAITTKVTVEAPGGLTIERSLPIAVYLTGLPEFSDIASTRTGATFARRFATTTLEPLSDKDLLLALSPFVNPGWEVMAGDGSVSYVQMTQEAAVRIAELSHGEPFLFQLAGERAWYAGRGAVITLEDVMVGWHAARREATAHVERILERLPNKERQFVETMASIEPEKRTATWIAKELGYAAAANIAPAARRLDTLRGIISRGSTYTFRHRALEAYLTSQWPNFE